MSSPFDMPALDRGNSGDSASVPEKTFFTNHDIQPTAIVNVVRQSGRISGVTVNGQDFPINGFGGNGFSQKGQTDMYEYGELIIDQSSYNRLVSAAIAITNARKTRSI